jgi:hypothetical protein
MATTIRSLSDTSADSVRYQPMSLFSVLAIVAAGLYTVLVLILTIVGLYTRKPVLELWLVLFAGIGIITAIAARWQISNSEGTLAGRKMANWALVISILVGCVYVAYYAGNILAIRNQANSFVQDTWLKALQDRKFEEAFFYALPPPDRQGMRPNAVVARFSDQIYVFRNLEFCHIFDEARGEVAIEPLGVRDLNQTPDGYVATLQYRLNTRAGEYDLAIGAIGMEGKELKGREWAVRRGAPFIQKRMMTPYGRLVFETQMDAERAIGDWLGTRINVTMQPEALAHLDTLPLPREQREKRYLEFVSRGLVVDCLAAGSTPAGGLASAVMLGAHIGDNPINRHIYLADAEDSWSKLVIIDTSKQDVPENEQQEMKARALRLGTIRPKGENIEVGSKLEIEKDSARVAKKGLMNFPPPLNTTLRAHIVAGCLDQKLIARLNELKSAPWDPKAPIQPDNEPSLLLGYKPDWYIAKVIVLPGKVQSPDAGRSGPAGMQQMQPGAVPPLGQ